MCSAYDMVCKDMAWKGFFAWSHTADMLCIEVHIQREKVRGGEHIDVRRNTIELFVCGCYESELCLWVIRGVFIPPILLKNIS